MADLPIAKTELVALFLESVFFGVYLVTLGMCLHVFCTSQEKIKLPVHVVTLLLACIGSLDLSLALRHALEAFASDTGPGVAKHVFGDIASWLEIIRTLTFILQIFIGDAFLTYRCFIIYSGSWKIISFPISLLLADTVLGIYILFVQATFHSSGLLNIRRLFPFETAFLSVTFTLNIFTSCEYTSLELALLGLAPSYNALIVRRIWNALPGRTLEGIGHLSGDGALQNALRIVIEAGLLYTLFALIMFGATLADSIALYPTSDMLGIIIGISFNLVIIRAEMFRKNRAFQFRHGDIIPPTLEFAEPAVSTTVLSSSVLDLSGTTAPIHWSDTVLMSERAKSNNNEISSDLGLNLTSPSESAV